MNPTPLTYDAVSAWIALSHVLSSLERPTPCQIDPDPFGSKRVAERREAAEACANCPALEACGRYAEAAGETWLVWAGVDRTPVYARKRRAVAA
ncbi:Transcriptional regulator WhiB2 [Nocardioides aquaticus]|uniref:Transcriptional regulator WhiB2 n=1 Tax=Nocardioides aquaticus TaxID=160826 RepID=A0ABX8EGB2_9ACTN|nr:WhiB family transcriptional regulator [Nocardioides aquaticus]QVT79560.1 Transcriptional regulator WhiB2 [Nocardioides aquaticus]